MAQPASNPKIEELRFRVKTDPKSRLFFPLAEELRKIDQLGEAEQVLRLGLGQHPTYLSAWVSFGRVLREENKHQEAVEALNKALQLDPGNVVAARLLADSHLDLGDRLEAIKKYKLVRALLPNDDEELEATIERLDRELNAPAPATAPFMADSEPAPLPETSMAEALPATEDNQVFADAEASLKTEQHVGDVTADREPMRAAHGESPFEEPVKDYSAAAVTVEKPPGIHVEPAPQGAEVPTPWSDEEAASDVFAPAEAPAPPPPTEDLANTVTMADLYVRQGFVEKAREIYQTILRREPDNSDVRGKLDALASGPAPGKEGAPRHPKAVKLEQWLAKVKKREEGSVV
ncbi:MAG TPA: tetratricopeptide repeat protein [Thermoanaerobaculia bacterium]|nr:tetratricopeptide repeat protein [Thermoanaerobaculia bacterium]